MKIKVLIIFFYLVKVKDIPLSPICKVYYWEKKFQKILKDKMKNVIELVFYFLLPNINESNKLKMNSYYSNWSHFP
jgi:hypothetical protein